MYFIFFARARAGDLYPSNDTREICMYHMKFRHGLEILYLGFRHLNTQKLYCGGDPGNLLSDREENGRQANFVVTYSSAVQSLHWLPPTFAGKGRWMVVWFRLSEVLQPELQKACMDFSCVEIILINLFAHVHVRVLKIILVLTVCSPFLQWNLSFSPYYGLFFFRRFITSLFNSVAL